MVPPSVDALIIGAGPAGAIAAATLVRQGYRALVVEKQWFPRHVIGESLLPRCNELLQQAGLLAAVEARGYTIKHGATFLRGDARQRFAFKDSLPGDWISSFQVPRDDLDQTLISAARAQGAEVRFGHEVQSVSFDDGGAVARVLDIERGAAHDVRARFVLDGSGPARVLSRLLGLDGPSLLMPRSAVYTHVEGDLRPQGDEAGDIWVVLHASGAWLWIIPFSNGRTSVGVVAEQAVFERMDGASDAEKLWAFIRSDPGAEGRLRGAVQVQPTRRLHGWSTTTRRLFGSGWAIAGNAGDFLDPVFSSGVMFALESGALAAQLAARQLRGEQIDWERDYQGHMQRAVQVFRTFVEAWYTGELATIFFSPRKPRQGILSITSILGGNVLNEQNPLVAQGTRAGLDRMLAGVAAIERAIAARGAGG